jgi:2-amino-4-hydroxy-6-hydroxymethyldihydropteridine diphosphokinase
VSLIAYIGFGANMGDRVATFFKALDALRDMPTSEVVAWSRLYETEPVGLTDGGPRFLNAAVAVKTDLSPHELIHRMRLIERGLGKSLHHRSDLSRTIDLDLLLYRDRRVSDRDLEVPHPRMHLRAFVLAPLCDLAADAVHPILGVSLQQLLDRLPRDDLAKVLPLERVAVNHAGEAARCASS